MMMVMIMVTVVVMVARVLIHKYIGTHIRATSVCLTEITSPRFTVSTTQR
jgi:hypothetical protein